MMLCKTYWELSASDSDWLIAVGRDAGWQNRGQRDVTVCVCVCCMPSVSHASLPAAVAVAGGVAVCMQCLVSYVPAVSHCELITCQNSSYGYGDGWR